MAEIAKASRGGSKPGERRGGRQKGTPNVATRNARTAIARLVDDNAERMQQWLDEIAATDGPAAAWKCLMDVVEYHIPKLARTEHVGDGGGAIKHDVALSEDTLRALKGLQEGT